MTADEVRLAELARERVELQARLKNCRETIIEVAKRVELPLALALNGDAVVIKRAPPPSAYGTRHEQIPQITVMRCVR